MNNTEGIVNNENFIIKNEVLDISYERGIAEGENKNKSNERSQNTVEINLSNPVVKIKNEVLDITYEGNKAGEVKNGLNYEKFKIKNEEVEINDDVTIVSAGEEEEITISSGEDEAKPEDVQRQTKTIDLPRILGNKLSKREMEIRLHFEELLHLSRINNIDPFQGVTFKGTEETSSSNEKSNEDEDGQEASIEDILADVMQSKIKKKTTKSGNISNPGNINETVNMTDYKFLFDNDITAYDSDTIKRLFSQYICDICSKSYKYKIKLINHITTKHKEGFLKCPYCEYRTSIKSLLYRHVHGVHKKLRVFKCTYCSYKTFNKSNFELHVSVKHTNKM